MNTPPSDPRMAALQSLMHVVYKKSKFWSALSIGLQVTLYLSAVVAVFLPSVTLKYPIVALPLAFVAAIISTKASRYKSTAESLKREHEYCDSFGKAPSGPRMASLKMDFPQKLHAETEALLNQGITYASSHPTGPVRALENLSESSWYSHHLAKFCAQALGWLFLVTMAVSIMLLYYCATDWSGTQAGAKGAQCVAATLSTLISIGLVRHYFGYTSYRDRSEKTDGEARKLLSGSSPLPEDVLRLTTEYQVARASAPLIPTWVWRLLKNRLNAGWALHSSRN